MMRRFSKMAFAFAFTVHFLATWWLFAASFKALAEWKRTGAADPLWLTVCGWIVQPVSMFAVHCLRVGFRPSDYFYFLMLPWMIAVALCFGFVIPRFSTRGRQII
jgi:hypothetical protein